MSRYSQIAYCYMQALQPAADAMQMNSAEFILFLDECQRDGVENPEDMTLGQVTAIMDTVNRRYSDLFGV